MQHDKTNPTQPPRLLPSLLLFAVSLIAAFLFGQSVQAPLAPADGGGAPMAQHTPADPSGHAAHDQAHAEDNTPRHYLGGLWNKTQGLGGLSELAALATSPQADLVCQSIGWDETAQKLIVIDVSPIRTSQRTSVEQGKTRAILSIDYRGGEVPADFGIAIQQHVESLADADNILIITPLPGPASLSPDAIPYDWTYLMTTEKVDILDWVEIEPVADMPGRPQSGYLLAWVKQAVPGFKIDSSVPVASLLSDLDALSDRGQAAQRLLAIAQRSPYQVVPKLREASGVDPDALNLMRAMGVHADDMIKQAMASDDPAIRALAARAIGDLADETTDPLGRLTLLAEDKDQAVRYEALVACRALPGRRAAGIAQLVGPYAMSDNMRRVYAGTMNQLLAYGEPIPADSRADRLRRMPIDELLAQERDALTSAILLQRTDLPDDKIGEVLTNLAEANAAEPLASLLNQLSVMNPRTIQERDVLLRTLASWQANELKGQQDRLVALIEQDGRPDELKAAGAAALMRAQPDPQAVIDTIGAGPTVFKGLAYLDDPATIKAWSPIVLATVLGEDDATRSAQIAALDALALISADDIKPALPRLLDLARKADDTEVRFAAIRAVNTLPDAIKPAGIDDLQLTSLTLVAVPGKIKYDLTELTAVAGRPVEITLINPDNMEHNLVITRPGKMQEVGSAVSAMPPAEAAAIRYVPDSDAVLYHTPMLRPGQTVTLRFIAPTKPGKYPYVCTFPGHYTSMNGVLELIEP